MHEVFNYLWIHRFDVTKAYELINQDCKVAKITIDIPKYAERFKLDLFNEDYEKWSHDLFLPRMDPKTIWALNADALASPGLIVLTKDEDFLLIDGHHRLARKYFQGEKLMQVWLLTDIDTINEFYECLDGNKALF